MHLITEQDLVEFRRHTGGIRHARFWDKVRKHPNGCWEWSASQDTSGYGQYRHAGRILKAHHWVAIHIHGPIVATLRVTQACDNRLCVNPDHIKVS